MMKYVVIILILIEVMKITGYVFDYLVTCKLNTDNDKNGEIKLYIKVMKKVFLSGIIIYSIFLILGILKTCTFLDMSDRKDLLFTTLGETIFALFLYKFIGRNDDYKISKTKDKMKKELLKEFIIFTICIIGNIITFIYYTV